MMRSILFLATFIFSFAPLFLRAQEGHPKDKIVLKDGTEIKGTILEKTKDYYIFKDENGESQLVNQSDVQVIEENKQEESYVEKEEPKPAQETLPDPRYTEDYGKNLITFNYLEFGILLNLNLSYERIFSDGFVGIVLNAAWSSDKYYTPNLQSAPYYYQERYMLDINVYPTGQHRASYFIGPSLGYGTYLTEDVTGGADIEHTYSSFLINNGVVLSLTPNFALSGKIGLGVIRSLDGDQYNGIQLSVPLFGFGLTGRF